MVVRLPAEMSRGLEAFEYTLRFEENHVMTALKLASLSLIALLAGSIAAASPAAEANVNHPATVKINAGAAAASAEAMHPDKKTRYPICGVQFTYNLSPYESVQFFTSGWPSGSYIDWTVMNDTNNSGGPDVSLSSIGTQGQGSTVTYWLTVENLTGSYQAIEGRYCFLG
jgi:hypothetical protein